MLSLLKKGPSANKVPAEKIQATYWSIPYAGAAKRISGIPGVLYRAQ